MAVDDRCTAGEATRQPLVTPGRGTAVVHHPDLHRAGCDDEFARQELLQRLLVSVPMYRVHRRPERPELLQERDREEIAAVHACPTGPPTLWQPSAGAGVLGVSVSDPQPRLACRRGFASNRKVCVAVAARGM